jgi:hypothetical protein
MRSCLAAIAAMLVLAMPAHAAGEQYAWSLSASSTDPFVQTGSPLPEPGPFDLWLWFVCHEGDGVAAAEFDLTVTGDFLVVTFSPIWPPVINLGVSASLLLAIGGCPTPPFLAGHFIMIDLGNGGTACLGPSATSGLNVSVDCGFPQPTAFPNGVLGYSSDGSKPCAIGDCVDIAVTAGPELEDATWGRIKGTYR